MKNITHLEFTVTVVSISLLCACGSTTPVGSHTYPSVTVSHVQVLYSEPSKPHEVIAMVSYTNLSILQSVSNAVEGLRGRAAGVGADAVVVTAASRPTIGHEGSASGKALKWTR